MKSIKPAGKFAKFFIKNYQISIILIILILAGGALGLLNLPKEGMPRVDVPYAGVTTIYPGATPQDVEEKITNPLEAAIKGLDNIKTTESSSQEGFSSVVVTFEAGADIGKSIDSLRQNIENASDKLPEDAENPVVTKFDATGVSIIANVVGPYDNIKLTENAKIIKKELERIQGVKEVNILGGAERKINIKLDFDKLNKFQISYQEVLGAIQGNNINLPGGTFSEKDKEFPIQIDARIKQTKDLEEIIIGTKGQNIIKLSDIAAIEDTYESSERIPRTGYIKDGELISNESISISIGTVKNSNLIQISDDIQAKLAQLEEEELDEDISTILVYDEADEARQQIGDLVRSAWQGLIVIFIVLFIFISLRSSLVIALSIPLSLLFVFLVFTFTDLTLNTVTLFSMILTLGILVDTTIVIVEGIQHNLQQGLNKKDAAVKSVSDVGGPIITATVTTILVFIPIAMMGGVTGEFIKFIPYTVITVLSGALLIALTIIPFLGKTFLKLSRRQENKIEQEGTAEWKIIKRYINRLRNIINSRFKKIIVLIAVIVLLFASLSLPATEKVKIDLWPQESDMDFFQIAVEYPKNTSDEVKDEIIKQVGDDIEELYRENNEISEILVSYAPFSLYGGPFALGLNQDTMIVKLTDMRKRKLSSSDVIEKLSGKFAQIEGAEIEASNFSMGPPASEFPIEVQITNKDLELAKEAALDLTSYLRSLEDVEKVKDGVDDEKAPQIQILLDQNKLNKLGIPAIQAAQVVRNIYQPEKVSELYDSKSNTNTDIYLDTQDTINKVDKLKDILVASSPQGPIKLGDIAEVNKVEELKKIDHYEGERYIEVKASLKENIDATIINNKINEYLNDDKLSELGLEKDAITFRGEFEEEEDAFNDFTEAFVMAMILIFMVLVFQFKSFIQPFIIMLAIPLSMIGVFFGLYITGNPVSFLGMLGIIALAGIVVNDSIVLIDRFNKLRQEGKSLKEAVVEGTRLRTRPVLSTSITTIGGILPLTIAISFWKPLGVAMISGLIASTILTLLVTPIIYYSFTSLTNKIFKRK